MRFTRSAFLMFKLATYHTKVNMYGYFQNLLKQIGSKYDGLDNEGLKI